MLLVSLRVVVDDVLHALVFGFRVGGLRRLRVRVGGRDVGRAVVEHASLKGSVSLLVFSPNDKDNFLIG